MFQQQLPQKSITDNFQITLHPAEIFACFDRSKREKENFFFLNDVRLDLITLLAPPNTYLHFWPSGIWRHLYWRFGRGWCILIGVSRSYQPRWSIRSELRRHHAGVNRIRKLVLRYSISRYVHHHDTRDKTPLAWMVGCFSYPPVMGSNSGEASLYSLFRFSYFLLGQAS